jgi:ribosomal protein S18 acetylase RimI-like enzyme
MSATFADGMLRPADALSMDTLMTWFSSAAETRVWGGPQFRYPFSADTFREDCRWPGLASYVYCEPDGNMSAFGQYYERERRIHLARLVVAPDRRGTGLGQRFIYALIQVAVEQLPLPELSLFVYPDNLAAIQCYRALGFHISESPPTQAIADKCLFMQLSVPDYKGRQAAGMSLPDR